MRSRPSSDARTFATSVLPTPASPSSSSGLSSENARGTRLAGARDARAGGAFGVPPLRGPRVGDDAHDERVVRERLDAEHARALADPVTQGLVQTELLQEILEDTAHPGHVLALR